MDKLDLETLPYPLFKTNWYEKRILRKALATPFEYKWLCVHISDTVDPYFKKTLLRKVSLASNGLLTRYFFNKGVKGLLHLPFNEEIELRKIWIRKLLEYKGE